RPLPDVSAPVLGVQLADGRWVGGSRFDALAENPPQVVGYTSRVTEQGQMFVEAQVNYELADGAFYRMTVRMLRDDSAIRMDEQWDLKRTGPPMHYQMVVHLNEPVKG